MSVRRLGATRSEAIDICIVTATNEDLGAAVRNRRFREDLYHRLAVVALTLPPLRERGDDILLLAEAALARSCVKYSGPARPVNRSSRRPARSVAREYRELNSVIDARSVVPTSGRPLGLRLPRNPRQRAVRDSRRGH
jgi:transcriptional regulator with GAF, ATPase, and Fis domain